MYSAYVRYIDKDPLKCADSDFLTVTTFQLKCSSYNALRRAADEIQYDAEAKLRLSNWILLEARGSGF